MEKNQRFEHTNQLINETSPYLLQHAHNPVNWYAWGEEAFEKAKKEDKPVFLSIGYSTCHWCHVMAHESFEDEEVAEALNRDFIAIKVDKEERPDIDNVYMNICQAMNGQGGWPLTVFMTPEQNPFFAATYYPKRSTGQMAGLMDILKIVSEKWATEKEKLIANSEEIASLLNKQTDTQPGAISYTLVENAVMMFRQMYDTKNGGFSAMPKFPTPHNLIFLLRYYHATKDESILAMVEKTLTQMYRGGIYDHIGFGFSRYATDEQWLVPHFEKMLYDNALLLIAYTEAYQVTQDPLYKRIAEEIITYVFRELTDPNGGFYCAQDADSEGEEGKYYIFTVEEILSLLGNEEGMRFVGYYGMSIEGNFEGKNILNLLNNDEFENTPEDIATLRKTVLEYRATRTVLHKDDKILTSWNGLMISALAKAAKVFQNNDYLEAAKKAMRFIEENALDETYHLAVSFRNNIAKGTGTIDDYAFILWGLLDLYESTFDFNYIKKALAIYKVMVSEFYDKQNGGFWLYGAEGEQLIHRPKEVYDGAIPSGNSVASHVLQKLAKLTADADLERLSKQQLRFVAGQISAYPAGYSFSVVAILSALRPSRELIGILEQEEEFTEIKQWLSTHYLPELSVLLLDKSEQFDAAKTIPFLTEFKANTDTSAYYLCEGHSCSAPIYDAQTLKERLIME